MRQIDHEANIVAERIAYAALLTLHKSVLYRNAHLTLPRLVFE